jgi:retron-type reverse transcriptase
MRRVAGSLSLTRNKSSAVQPKNIPKKLEKIIEISNNHPYGIIDRNVYSLMLEKNMYLIAYDILKSKPGNMIRGLNPETLDGLSSEWIDNVIKELKDETFQFKPARSIMIPKANGKLRPLTIASPRDKIVQQVMY